MRNAILAAFVVFVAAVLVTGAQGYPTPTCTCPDGYVAQCVAMTAVPPTVTPAPTSGGGEMASEGPNSPDTAVNYAGAGNYAWSDPGNAVSSNNSYAVWDNQYNYDLESQYLFATDFDFAIPVGATIDGIVVEIEAKSDTPDGDSYMSLYRVTLDIDGDLSTYDGPSTKITNQTLTDTDTYYSVGGAADTWGRSWSAAEINGSGFGASVTANGYNMGGNSHLAYVDHIRITVYYTEGVGGATRSQYRAMLGAGW